MNSAEFNDISTFEEFESYTNKVIIDNNFSLDLNKLKFSIFDEFKIK